MSARIIDGKAFAADLRGRIKLAAEGLILRTGVTPGLAVILVGDDPASEVYVRNKGIAAREVGFNSFEFRMPAKTSEAELLAQIAALNADPAVHGILVQMPVPKQINPQTVIEAIDPLKDVDGLHPVNAGRLMAGINGEAQGLVSCTPLGCMMLLRSVRPKLRGQRAVVIGRSNLVGKPMGQLLLQADCTVTMAHSATDALPDLCRMADILVVAVGRPGMVRGGWVKHGAIVLDVGINRVPAGAGKTKLVGDVATEECLPIAEAITPVPGGVGPMTPACLLRNTLFATAMTAGEKAPAL
ncbi:MAG: bifunctional methylenetetrahydrofolate dehydrogenase/methenyltetrahydrofolate cyclohydrolase FolD [Alphaproteobacteria bacterium]|nr:bifunctional methylenetetrahydrofolate dehydrogenase/methenyltetrahydrofolate cyclohydrolase FolD [Alphaproteobacteria bacterium]